MTKSSDERQILRHAKIKAAAERWAAEQCCIKAKPIDYDSGGVGQRERRGIVKDRDGPR